MIKDSCQGYVLHRLPYRETSLLVDLITREQGKVRVVAKGVRGSKSDRKSLLQPFQLLECRVTGRNELKNLGHVEAMASRIELQHQSLFCGLYLNELVSRALPIDLPSEEIFDAYQDVLRQLCALSVESYSAHIEVLLREFELHLLLRLGYLPDFNHCGATGLPLYDNDHYEFIPDTGFVAVANTSVSTGNKIVFKGCDILSIANHDWHADSLRAAKHLMRLALPVVIGDKPLRSRALFAQVK
ncbi:DNA repair protein RecO [Alteromonas facilis]|uniref:DNA repair protein RecO n=1 Tax=Alteromonas facilis TaxID=2048004 RepID=UPI000C283FE8|nr:DNA repair protein RecO [Alteromonas facilis]